MRDELEEIQKKYGEPRRTRIEETEEVEYSADAFIVEEDNVVIVSRDGWVKRQKEVKDLSTTRLREGDSVLAAVAGSTRATVVFFSNFGVAYTARFVDIPASTGYGEPIQKLFKLKDGERVVAALSLDPRVIGEIAAQPGRRRAAGPRRGDDERRLRAALLARAVRRAEHARRPPLRAHGGRRRGRDGRRAPTATKSVIAATADARALLCKVDEVNFLSGPGPRRDPDQGELPRRQGDRRAASRSAIAI